MLFYVYNPPLTYAIGTMTVSPTAGVHLSLTMGGMWEKPFGIPFIAFGNIMLGTGVDPKKPLPAFGEFFIVFPSTLVQDISTILWFCWKDKTL